MTAEATPDSLHAETVSPRPRTRTKKAAAITPAPTTETVAKAATQAKARSKAKAKDAAPKVVRPRKTPAISAAAAATSSAARSASTAQPKLRLHNKEPDAARTSQILEEILTKNPDLESFTVEKILLTLGTTSFGTSLMFFAIPEVLPIPLPGVSALVVLPTAVLGAQMASGRRGVRLPDFLLKREVPRRALAAAIYAILPVLRKAETVTKPRWKWASSPVAQRLLGVFVFLLALSIAFPIPGFNMPQAIAIFVIGLGLVEKDGLIICLGVVLGLASLALLGAVVIGLASFLGF